MNTRKDFGQRIVAIRNEKNITQEQLAEKADVTRNNISRIENGKYNPGLDILLRIGDALVSDLLYK